MSTGEAIERSYSEVIVRGRPDKPLDLTDNLNINVYQTRVVHGEDIALSVARPLQLLKSSCSTQRVDFAFLVIVTTSYY